MSFCGYPTYEAYLQSHKWSKKREAALKEADYKCSICGGKDNLQVHHLSYKEVEGEDVSQVRVLCRPCHEKVHASVEYVQGRYGMILQTLMSTILADAMAVLWKGQVPSGSTTRLKGYLLKEFERTFVWSGQEAPAIYKMHHSGNHPDAQFNKLIETTTKVWNLHGGDGK